MEGFYEGNENEKWDLFMSKGGVKMMKNGVLRSLSLGKQQVL